ncbi:hypothetical protein SOVF_150740 [Spinacia oleracea]|nr:hypothetical protein SOVF_150740 [Spinacia oleracea]
MGESFTHVPCLQESVSFGRFEHDSLCWERWSAFPTNKYLEEVEKCSTPGSVAQKKAYFEAHYKRIAARKAELLDQEMKREEGESVDSEDQGSMCNTSEEEFDVDGTQVLNEVGEFSGEMSDKHIDILGHNADIMIEEEDGVSDLTTEVEVTEHIDELSDDFDVIDEVVDLTVEVREHVDQLAEENKDIQPVYVEELNSAADLITENKDIQPVYVEELNNGADLIKENKDIQPVYVEELNNGTDLIKENKDIQPEHFDEAGVAEEKMNIQLEHIDESNSTTDIREENKSIQPEHFDVPGEKMDILPEHIDGSNSGTDVSEENQDIQPHLEDGDEDLHLNMEIPHVEKPDKPVLVKEDTASARVWQDKEVLPQEKVEERKKVQKETKNPIKLVDPVKIKKTTLAKRTVDTPNSKKKPASTIAKKPAASMAKSPIISTPKSLKPELTKTVKSTSRPSTRKESGNTPLTSKKTTKPENKRVLPTSLHMSLSFGPANSEPVNSAAVNSDPASLTAMRKSSIMESMGDKDIVKRAFKAFQNVNQLSPTSLVKPTTTNEPTNKRIEVKGTAPDALQKRKEGISRAGKVTNPITGLQGTKKLSQSPGLKKNIGVDQRNGKAIPASFGSRNGKYVPASFGSRSLDQGRLQREVPKKLEPKTNTKDSVKTQLQSKLKAEKAADSGKPTRSINSKPNLSSSCNQGHGFLRGSVRKVEAKI